MGKGKNRPVDRAVLWQAMRDRKSFTAAGIASATGARFADVKTYIWLLAKTGFVKSTRPDAYVLMKDTGRTPPDLTMDARKPSAAQRMWAAMKVLKTFTAIDLAFPAEVKKTEARQYCNFLAKAEYLLPRKGASAGSTGVFYLFNPRKDTGFNAPQVRRRRKGGREVYDRNQHRVVWPKEAA